MVSTASVIYHNIVFTDCLSVWFFYRKFYKVFERCLRISFRNQGSVHFYGQVTVGKVFFCMLNLLSWLDSLFRIFKICPCLLKWIICIKLWWRLSRFCWRLCLRLWRSGRKNGSSWRSRGLLLIYWLYNLFRSDGSLNIIRLLLF